jgi:hypothetical protein
MAKPPLAARNMVHETEAAAEEEYVAPPEDRLLPHEIAAIRHLLQERHGDILARFPPEAVAHGELSSRPIDEARAGPSDYPLGDD